MYTYGYILENANLRVLLISLKLYLDFLTYPGLECVVALLYCFSCLHCSKDIQSLIQEIDKHSDDSFTPKIQINILKRKMKIDTFLDEIQAAFSVPTFLVIASGFLSCSQMFGQSIIFYNWYKYDNPDLIASAIHVIASSSSMIVILWTAGGITVALRLLKESFYRKAHSRYISHRISEELHIKRELLEKPDFVPSGCDIMSYSRSSIFVIAGALLTYSVLMAQTSEH
ncbi:hypothetical protein HNY73_003836 [Argiope bruennichi]|uniref:Uncharacterized protein n=1 Tax=Argiope bruennichi TaxID=94029 RepID=A0A8T0FRB3_ARGBR|nr:hypothetical protein HNY73_003836 [Argiope bruennichi]